MPLGSNDAQALREIAEVHKGDLAMQRLSVHMSRKPRICAIFAGGQASRCFAIVDNER